MNEHTYECSPSVEEAAARLKESHLWNHHDVVVAWIEAGLPFLSCFLRAHDIRMKEKLFY